jgi:hypothetical protein
MATLITLQNETTLRQVAERAFGTLDEKDRRSAEAALLKANPQLATRDAFRPGAVLRVPSVGDLAPTAAAAPDDPVSDVREAIGAALELYRGRLGTNLDAVTSELATQEALLKDREVAAALRKAGAVEITKELHESLRARAQAFAEERKRQEALFARLRDDLKGFDIS